MSEFAPDLFAPSILKSGLSRRSFLALSGAGVLALASVNTLIQPDEAGAQIWYYCVTFITTTSTVLIWPTCGYATWVFTVCTLYGVIVNYYIDVKDASVGWC